jgi:hypothetical protein
MVLKISNESMSLNSCIINLSFYEILINKPRNYLEMFVKIIIKFSFSKHIKTITSRIQKKKLNFK